MSCFTCLFQPPSQFQEETFPLRSLDQHLDHCALLEQHAEYSKEFGVNRRSVVLDLQHFNPCDGSLLPDVMHDVLEGTLEYQAKLLLMQLVYTRKLFKLKVLNDAIEGIEMGYIEANNRPAPIPKHAFKAGDNLLKQKGRLFFVSYLCNQKLISSLIYSFSDVGPGASVAICGRKVCS